jgi:hypothetical protein
METLTLAAGSVLATIRDVLPIAAIVIGFQLFGLRQPIRNAPRVFVGFVYVLLGLGLFLFGLEKALFPLGRVMAEQFTHPQFLVPEALGAPVPIDWTEYYWVFIFAFAIGFATTIAEPSLIAVALKAHEVSAGAIGTWGLRVAVALGVAVGISLGAFRIVVGHPIHYYIILGYVIVVIQTGFAPRTIVPLAYDSGGVTTSTVTVPLVAALGLSLAESVPGRNPLIDGFGLIAFASLFPIMSVMAYAQLAERRQRRDERRAKNEHTAADRPRKGV